MNSWNYRVEHRIYAPWDEHQFVIVEVYYEGDEIVARSVDAISPMGETIEELRNDLTRMLEALDRDTLEAEDE